MVVPGCHRWLKSFGVTKEHVLERREAVMGVLLARDRQLADWLRNPEEWPQRQIKWTDNCWEDIKTIGDHFYNVLQVPCTVTNLRHLPYCLGVGESSTHTPADRMEPNPLYIFRQQWKSADDAEDADGAAEDGADDMQVAAAGDEPAVDITGDDLDDGDRMPSSPDDEMGDG